jgi:uncharacterized protein YdeI (YjbR/CyaY-like superfamily)
MNMTKTIYVKNRAQWQAWLKNNYNKEKEIWLVYYKAYTKKPTIPYDDSVEEALCYGWIDSIIKRIDDKKYARKFTPRTNKNKWSEVNKKRIRKLIKEERMTEIGLAKVDMSRLNKKEETLKDKLKPELILPPQIKKQLMENKIVWDNFNKLAPSHKRNYIGWITSAKKEETQIKRVKEAIELLKENKKLGLK